MWYNSLLSMLIISKYKACLILTLLHITFLELYPLNVFKYQHFFHSWVVSWISNCHVLFKFMVISWVDHCHVHTKDWVVSWVSNQRLIILADICGPLHLSCMYNMWYIEIISLNFPSLPEYVTWSCVIFSFFLIFPRVSNTANYICYNNLYC